MNFKKMMIWGMIAASSYACSTAFAKIANPLSTSNDSFEGLSYQIKNTDFDSKAYKRLEKEVFNRQALVWKSDKTPVDIVIRRTVALIKLLKKNNPSLDLSGEISIFDKLKSKNNSVVLTLDEQKKLFNEIKAVRRKIAFKNPLINFNDIAFIKHDKMKRGEIHMVDQYLGFNSSKNGGVYILKDAFGGKSRVESLLSDVPVSNGRLKGKIIENDGGFISLELDYDAKSILFAYTEAEYDKFAACDIPNNLLDEMKNIHVKNPNRPRHARHYAWNEERVYHIFKYDIENKKLIQLTDGKYNDIDPCFLPNGRIVFISDRIGGNQRCGGRVCTTYTLHGMMGDGSDIIPFSYHDTNEWQPSVDHSGMIIYTRWDYVDRDSDVAHHIWHCYPDGRNPRSYHGNYPKIRESRPWMEMNNRAIPNSNKYISVAAPHHGENYGSIVIIDVNVADDGAMSQVKRVTPEVAFPESEIAPAVMGRLHGGRHNPQYEVFGQPWALSEDFYLAVFDANQKKYGLYLVDALGNKELLYKDEKIALLDPIPFKARTRPPVIPIQTKQAKADRHGETDAELEYGTVMISNIYNMDQPLPKNVKIKELRIVNIFAKPNAYQREPKVGVAAQSLTRGVLGTVPVEKDGSVFFKCPVGMPIYFQALDENGVMVQNMRSATYLHEAETMSCLGCHEPKIDTPEVKKDMRPKAFMRPPSTIKKESIGSYPIQFSRLVQPVLDKNCISCHDGREKLPDLRGYTKEKQNRYGWTPAMVTLSNYAWAKAGGNGALRYNKRSYSIPMHEGARVSKLYNLIKDGKHKDVKLNKEDMRRITLWLDCNSNFYGAYYNTEAQSKGEVVQPLLSLPKYVPFQDLVR
ncbi:hypothetical protein AAEX28_09920 [Lentisphaerota bacterium WC36G]|nr:hypothetical protein LJT99_12755 [Lentisphaerae bacterium WC36]